jgi:hypothetical protein
VLLETDARISGEAFRVRVESAQEGRHLFAHFLIPRRPLVCWFPHFRLHFHHTGSAHPGLPAEHCQEVETPRAQISSTGYLTYRESERGVYGTLVLRDFL